MKEALGVKYFSIVARWVEGGDCVRRCIMLGISVRGSSILSCNWRAEEGKGKEEREEREKRRAAGEELG